MPSGFAGARGFLWEYLACKKSGLDRSNHEGKTLPGRITMKRFMPSRMLLAGILAAVLFTAPLISRVSAQAGRAAATAPSSTTQSDQSDLSLTVYNSDLALVRDVRQITLCPAGTFQLKFMDIAASINPATVHFRSLERSRAPQRPRTELRVRPARARKSCSRNTWAAGDTAQPGAPMAGTGGSEGHAARRQ